MEPNFSGLLAAVQFAQIRATKPTTVLARPTGTPLKNILAAKKPAGMVLRETTRPKK